MRMMNFKVVCFVTLLCAVGLSGAYASSAGKEKNTLLHAETWDMSRHGEVLLKVQALVVIIKDWQKNTENKIELRYPGGEEGELWVEELKDWLVSLGVPSRNIELLPGSDAQDVINMALIE